MKRARPDHGERGIALVLVLLVAIAVTALALGGITLSSGGALTSRYQYRELALEAAGDAGAELARDSLNRNPALLPDSGYATVEEGAAVRDASGAIIPGFSRSVYVGRTGGRTGGAATAGQYGTNFASALSVIRDARGAVAVRRLLLSEESWARYAYAFNRWSSGSTGFCGETVVGPVHSNANILIACSPTPVSTFLGPVTTVGTILNKTGGSFPAGYTERVSPVEWPSASDLAKLQTYAQESGADYDIDGTVSATTSFAPTTRIEFVTFDLDRNGVIDPNEGFFRVFQARAADDSLQAYVTAKRWPNVPLGSAGQDPNLASRNCGAVTRINGVGPLLFRTASEVFTGTTGTPAAKRDSVRALLTSGSRRCFLGGDPHLFPAATGDTITPDSTLTLPFGRWLTRAGGTPVPAGLAAIRPGDEQYFIPIQGNVNFKGVIYVRGPVGISGRLRGRVTIAATGNILLADDLLYSIPPGTDCSETGDILGVTTPEAVPIEDNNVQSPFRVAGNPTGLFDDTPDNENYQMFILTLKQFYGEDARSNPGTYDAGAPIPGERCAITPDAKSGCVRVSGGIIEGDVGSPTYNAASSGWAEAHAYDKCGLSSPPPYFPTTGRYLQNRVYELDPVWLSRIGVAQYFRELQSR